MQIKMYYFFAGILAVLLLSKSSPGIWAEEDAEKVYEDEIAAGLLNALLQNNRSLEKFDVSFKHEMSDFSDPEKMVSTQLFCRVKADRVSEQYLVGRRSTYEKWDLGGEPVTKADNRVTFVNGNGEFRRYSLAGVQSGKLNDRARLQMYMGMPNFSLSGLEGFPSVDLQEFEEHTFWDRVVIPKRGLAVRRAGRNLTNVVWEIDRGPGADAGWHEWMFDIERLVPVSRRVYFATSIDAKRSLKEFERLVWVEINGVSVPTASIRTVNQSRRNKETGDIERYEQSFNTWAHWHSVNEDLGDWDTQLEWFDSSQKIEEFVMEYADEIAEAESGS